MHRAVVRVAVVVGLTALLSACTSNDAPQAASTVAPTTVPPTTTTPTTLIPSTTTTRPETTTTIEGQVGSREALGEAMQQAVEASEALFGVDPSSVSVPNLTDPDPVVALEALLHLDFWVYRHAPVEEWASILAEPQSPDWTLYRRLLATQGFRTAAFEGDIAEPFKILEARLATPQEIEAIPADVLAKAGPAAASLVFRTAMAAHTLMDSEEPGLDEERAGWEDRTQVGILVPTDIGWQFFWSQVR